MKNKTSQQIRGHHNPWKKIAKFMSIFVYVFILWGAYNMNTWIDDIHK